MQLVPVEWHVRGLKGVHVETKRWFDGFEVLCELVRCLPSQEFSHGMVVNVEEIDGLAAQNENERVAELPHLAT
jgi:hypothetical protein